MTFRPVSEKDDWGYITTLIGRAEFAMPQSGWIWVKFPDGTVDKLKIEMRMHSEHLNDMGHELNVISKIPHVFIKTRGATFPVRLGTSKLLVTYEKP